MVDKQQLAELEQLIVDKHPAAQFKAGIDPKVLQAFESANGLKLPQELVTFYNWHNGVCINSKLYLPSLEEAYKLFKTHKSAQQNDAIWLPIYVIDHKPYYDKEDLYSYLFPTSNSKFKDDVPNSVKISDNAIFLSSYKGNQYVVKSLYEVINSLIDRLNPPKMTFRENIKDFFEIFGRLFERF